MIDEAVVCTFRVLCNKRWKDLQAIAGETDVRYCGQCTKPVFRCDEYDTLAEYIAEGRCVCIVNHGTELLGEMISYDVIED